MNDRLIVSFFALILATCALLPTNSLASEDQETTFISVENHTGQFAKVAAPGSKTIRVAPGTMDIVMELVPTDPNGIEAKAWWISNPRELCVIFIRYGGVLKITGKTTIRCLGN